jgi:hypothetical protein
MSAWFGRAEASEIWGEQYYQWGRLGWLMRKRSIGIDALRHRASRSKLEQTCIAETAISPGLKSVQDGYRGEKSACGRQATWDNSKRENDFVSMDERLFCLKPFKWFEVSGWYEPKETYFCVVPGG